MYLRDRTDGWKCSTKNASSPLRRRHHARASFGASLAEPYIHQYLIFPATDLVENGWPDWRLWTPRSPTTPPTATVAEEFASCNSDTQEAHATTDCQMESGA